MKIFKFTIHKKYKRTLIYLHLKALIFSVDQSMIFLLQAVVFSYGLKLLVNGEVTVVNLFEFYAMLGITRLIIIEGYAGLPDYKNAKNAAKTAFKIINRKPRIDSMSDEGIRLEKLTGNIEFKNVEFSYPSSPDDKVLSGFNLVIKNGQTNALVGKSGCGKSTVCALLLRFYDVTGGEILIDGKNIRSFNVQWLRSQIGVVSQESVLFDMSIKENILNGDIHRENVSYKHTLKFNMHTHLFFLSFFSWVTN